MCINREGLNFNAINSIHHLPIILQLILISFLKEDFQKGANIDLLCCFDLQQKVYEIIMMACVHQTPAEFSGQLDVSRSQERHDILMAIIETHSTHSKGLPIRRHLHW